ncbi:MAG TPA: NYN domain-containing protein [Thermoanaerobaculia bacterium]|nr:NYN domain-containing protein [Thermoanaerobaculia bacterium]
MQDSHPSPTHLRTALFVDFDNIYLGLQREDPVAAEQFATDPTRWLTWLQDRLPHHLEDHRRRKILFRRCYLNPSQFGRFRPYFTRSAIEVVDCPPLTSGGKTSADIHMVMDILDTLSHPTLFDEFILLSGDADFTPVLLRLSKHDRRSAILAIGPASVAYKAACDLLIDQDTFLEEAIGATPNPTARAAAGPSNSAMSDLLRGIADKIYERTSTSGELVATELPPIFREFSEFTSSNNWLGFNSLRNMTTAVVSMRRDLTMIDGDPWRVGLCPEGEEPAEAPEASPDPGRGAVAPRLLTITDRNRLIEEILVHVRSVVDASDSAVPMARAAQMVISRFGEQVLATRWAGAGTFRDLLEGRENPGFAISALKPGYIYDPARHQLPIDGRPEELVGDPQLNALAYRVHQLTDTPYLTRGDYARVFRLTAEEVNDHGYFLTRTSKSVRDRCIEEGSPIARASVNFILRGITFGGHRFGQNGSEEPLDLGACFFRNVVSLCDTVGIALDDHERETLSDWILGELRAEAGIHFSPNSSQEAGGDEEAVAVGKDAGTHPDPDAGS